MAYEFFVNDSESNGVQMQKADFVRKECKEFMENKEWVAMKNGASDAVAGGTGRGSTEDTVEHCKKSIPVGHYSGIQWLRNSQKQKRGRIGREKSIFTSDIAAWARALMVVAAELGQVPFAHAIPAEPYAMPALYDII